MDLSSRVYFRHPVQQTLQIGIRQEARGHGKLLRLPIVLFFSQGIHELLIQEPDHPHAVFQLDIAVIAAFLRKLPFC